MLFTAADRVAADRIRVTDRRLDHLLQVHRAVVGDSIRVGEVNGLIGLGEIQTIDVDGASIQLSLDTSPPAKLPLTLILALPRPKMLRRILRSAAEFGVRELHLIHSYRVEKSYWQTPVLAPEIIRDYLIQGLEQARDTMLPTVHCHRRFKPFVEDSLPAMIGSAQALLAQPGDYPPCPRGQSVETLLVVGPEGGFIPYEIDKLVHSGCTAVSLGPRILRVENAVNALLGRLF